MDLHTSGKQKHQRHNEVADVLEVSGLYVGFVYREEVGRDNYNTCR